MTRSLWPRISDPRLRSYFQRAVLCSLAGETREAAPRRMSRNVPMVRQYDCRRTAEELVKTDQSTRYVCRCRTAVLRMAQLRAVRMIWWPVRYQTVS